MADPLSVTASVSSLVVISAHIVGTIRDFCQAYTEAPLMITSIASECTIIQASLAALQTILLDDNQASNLPGTAVQALDTSLVGCALTLSVVDKEISKYIRKNSDTLSRAVTRKTLFTFEKLHFEELLNQLRGHQVALTLLLTIMHTRSIGELKQSADAQYAFLEKIVSRARSLWQDSQDGREVPDTVVGCDDSVFELSSLVSDTRFDFDSIIMHSQAYRRSLTTLKLYEVRKDTVKAHESVVSGFQAAEEDAVVTELEDERTPNEPPDFGSLRKHASIPEHPSHASNSATAANTVLESNTNVSEVIGLALSSAENPALATDDAEHRLSNGPGKTSNSEQSLTDPGYGPAPPACYAAPSRNFVIFREPEVTTPTLADDCLPLISQPTGQPRPDSAIGLPNTPVQNDTPKEHAPESPTSPPPISPSTLLTQSTRSISRSQSSSTINTSLATTITPTHDHFPSTPDTSSKTISLIPLNAMVIGDSFCGKSTLCHLLATGKSQFNHNQDPRKLHTVSFSHTNHKYYLDLLDPPGHLSMNQKPSIPQPHINVLLMCFAINSMESLENLQYVMKPLLSSTYLGVPAILIGCKSDLEATTPTSPLAYADRYVTVDEAQATQAVLGAVDYLQCSATTMSSLSGTDEVLRVMAHWAMQHKAFVSGLSRSRRLLRRSSISKLNVQQTKNQILRHECDFRRWITT